MVGATVALQYPPFSNFFSADIWLFFQQIFMKILCCVGASLIAQLVKNPPAMQETTVQFLGLEDPLEKE